MTKALLLLVLLAGALVVAVSGSLAKPGSMPDESHHYAYVKYVAEHPAAFPIAYERIFTNGENRPNHLVHPPLYYYLMAVAYRVVDPGKDLGELGRELDRHGRYSAQAMIPVLRVVSLFFVLAGLWGLYLLLRFLVARAGLQRWMALAAAALVCFVPGFTYVLGGLNNDVLVFALWPYGALSVFRYLYSPRETYFWRSVAWLAALVLSKSTIWILVACLGAALLAARVLAFIRRPQRSAARRRPMPRTAVLVAVLLAGFAAAQLSSNLIRYGSLQPGYHVVYGIPIESSKYYKLAGREAEVAAEGPAAVLWPGAERMMKTLAGPMGHGERFYARNPGRLIQLLGLSLLLLIVPSLGYFFSPRHSGASKLAVLLCLFAPLCMVGLFFSHAYTVYKAHGYFGAQGRYLIGYLQLMVVGACVAASGARWEARPLELLRRGCALLGICGLGFILCRPLAYIGSSLEILSRSGMQEQIPAELRRLGFNELAVTEWAPEKLGTHGYTAHAPTGPGGYYTMAWTRSTLGAKLPALPPGSSVEVAIWAKGDDILGAPAELGIRIAASGAAGAPQQPEAIFPLDDTIGLYRTVLPINEAGERTLYVQLLNGRPESWPQELWPLQRAPVVYRLLYKAEEPNER